MKFYKKRWIQSGIILISSLGIVLSVFPSFADDNIDNLKGQTSALESELDGINKDILSLSEETADPDCDLCNHRKTAVLHRPFFVSLYPQ